MIIDEFQFWRIAIGDSLKECVVPWENQGFTVNHFEAITPDTMPGILKFGNKHRHYHKKYNKIVPFTSTEKAIWYSHFMLWEKCIEEYTPFIIIEHDVIPITEFPKTWDVRTLKYFCKSSEPDRYAKTNVIKYTPAAGYIVTPKGARNLIKMATTGAVLSNVDSYVQAARDKNPDHLKGGWARHYANQIIHEKTITHDEKIDISSIHRDT